MESVALCRMICCVLTLCSWGLEFLCQFTEFCGCGGGSHSVLQLLFMWKNISCFKNMKISHWLHQMLAQKCTRFSLPFRMSRGPLKQICGGFWVELWAPLPMVLFSQALIWLPCGTVLTGGMHDDFNPNPAFMKCNLPQLTAADVSDKWTWAITYFEGLNWKVSVFHSVACEAGMTFLFGFLHRILFVMMWLAETAWMIGSPDFCPCWLLRHSCGFHLWSFFSTPAQ